MLYLSFPEIIERSSWVPIINHFRVILGWNLSVPSRCEWENGRGANITCQKHLMQLTYQFSFLNTYLRSGESWRMHEGPIMRHSSFNQSCLRKRNLAHLLKGPRGETRLFCRVIVFCTLSPFSRNVGRHKSFNLHCFKTEESCPSLERSEGPKPDCSLISWNPKHAHETKRE